MCVCVCVCVFSVKYVIMTYFLKKEKKNPEPKSTCFH